MKAMYTVMMPRINIMGLGINGTKHLSLETISVLKKCEIVYVIPQTLMNQKTIGDLNFYNSNIVDLSYLYKHDELDIDIYTRMSKVIWEGSKKCEVVGLIVPGNPVICVNVTQILINNCRKKKISFKIYPAISSIDTILAELGLDIGKRGISIFVADRIVIENKKIDNETDLLILQIGAAGSALMKLKTDSDKDRFDCVHKLLLSQYPLNHKVFFITTDNGCQERTRIIEKEMRNLFDNHRDIDNLTTLYIPALPCKINTDYINQLKQTS